MDVGIGIEVDAETANKAHVIQAVSDSLRMFFKDKDYGKDLLALSIGFICVRDVPGYEEFSRKRPPRYSARRKVEPINGPEEFVTNHFSYSVKLDQDKYEMFLQATDSRALEIVVKELRASTSIFDKLPRKVRDFDAVKFKSDMDAELNRLLA